MSDKEEHYESEFYYPNKLEFQDNNSNLTETNNKRVSHFPRGRWHFSLRIDDFPLILKDVDEIFLVVYITWP